MGELDMYSKEQQEEDERILPNDMDFLAEFSKQNDNVDFAGRMIWAPITDKEGKPLTDKDGKPQLQEVFNFGKYKDYPVAEVLKRIRLREFNKHSC